MEDKCVLKGRFIAVRFRNDVTGFTVARFKMLDLVEDECVVTGILPAIQLEVNYQIQGQYREHEKYGMQFVIDTIERLLPSDEDTLIRYFSSALFPGIGKKTAQLIVDSLGSDAIQKIKNNHQCLSDIIHNSKKERIIIEGLGSENEMDDSLQFFNRIGLTPKQILKVESIYGQEAKHIISQNPYQLIEDIDGFGFKTADKIANHIGFDMEHPARIKAIVLSVLMEFCMSNGNSFILYDRLLEIAKKKVNKLGLLADSFDFEEMIEELNFERSIVIENNQVYHHTQYDAERGIAQFVAEFPYTASESFDFDVEQEISMLEEKIGICYEEHQKEAIFQFFKEPLMILTGGPGTGKTTIVKGIIELYKKHFPYHQIALCAPTGRAAKRLSECSEDSAMTIHRLLKWDLETNTFAMNENDPLVADLLIIDEFSMVDQWLFYNLLLASKRVRRILLIGDEHQLPSVGPGSVLRDLIASDQVPLTRLSKIFRQANGSDVVELAQHIKDGEFVMPESGGDVAFFQSSSYRIKDLVMQIVQNAFEKGYDLNDVQVLAPMYQGVSGIDGLNLHLQKMCNPPASYKKELRLGYRTFREGDKVLQLKNQPDDDVYNGDIGIIEEIVLADEDFNHQNRIFANFDGIIVEYTQENFSNLTHAYCISIHKSQGSEYPIVIMPIVNEHIYMLERRLIYTGITRAKKSLVLLGEQRVLAQALKKVNVAPRETTLKERILNYFE